MNPTSPQGIRRRIAVLTIVMMSLIPAWTVGLWWTMLNPERQAWVLRVGVAVIIVILIVGTRSIIRFIRANEHFTRGYCRGCGYDLLGLQERRCPECNTPF